MPVLIFLMLFLVNVGIMSFAIPDLFEIPEALVATGICALVFAVFETLWIYKD